MEKILEPWRLELANRCWDNTLRAVGIVPGEKMTDDQLSKLGRYVTVELVSFRRRPRPAIPSGIFIPKKKRGSPATKTNNKSNAVEPTHHRSLQPQPIIKKQRKPTTVAAQPRQEGCPVLPAAFRETMAGMEAGEMTFLTQKVLENSDVNKTHSRMLIPVREMEECLTAEEKKQVRNGMVVQVIEPSGRAVCQLKMKVWTMGGNEYCALNGGWNGVVGRNGLVASKTLQVWSFRVGSESKLGLALVLKV